MDGPVNSVLNLWDKDENNLDFGFVKNALRCVLHECYPTAEWQPSGVFAEESMNYPLSLRVKSAVKICFESIKENILDDFQVDFPCKHSITDRSLFDHLLYFKLVFERQPFYIASFLEFLCRCLGYTMLSYWYGIELAPQITLHVICIMMREMRESGKITESFWKEFEEFCEIYLQDEERRKLSEPKRRWKKVS
ncbi:unnamed protein product [Larinioides sclopetarius]|uniref:Uncharacterized protein n=1 Tax=Larinioides sclopetarius TaxID=280406 RepID=A0AAV1ZSF4_9ARAC